MFDRKWKTMKGLAYTMYLTGGFSSKIRGEEYHSGTQKAVE